MIWKRKKVREIEFEFKINGIEFIMNAPYSVYLIKNKTLIESKIKSAVKKRYYPLSSSYETDLRAIKIFVRSKLTRIAREKSLEVFK